MVDGFWRKCSDCRYRQANTVQSGTSNMTPLIALRYPHVTEAFFNRDALAFRVGSHKRSNYRGLRKLPLTCLQAGRREILPTCIVLAEITSKGVCCLTTLTLLSHHHDRVAVTNHYRTL